MAVVEGLVSLWKDWGIQVLVLLSFTVQVILLITAEIRRLKDSGVLRVIVWSAYLMADSTAIYALGHMSVTSRLPEHQMMAFWAPFLLLHLGGQDNITAYAIEDNRLWLRHLQALGVQAAAAAFILYEFFTICTDSMLWWAAILMIMVGFLKYGERVWALKCASSSNLPNKNYMSGLRRIGEPLAVSKEPQDTEDLLWTAHLLLNIPKKFFERPLGKTGQDNIKWDGAVAQKKLFGLVEMQLALMHDVLYSKAEVMHTWYGLCIRIISSASTAVAFVLFHWSGHRHGYSRADVAITYALLVGAIVLETISLLRAIFSSWALARMRPVRRLVLGKRSRWWWSDSMGQHSLFEVYDSIKKSRCSRIARWMGYEDWWNTRVNSRRIPVSEKMKGFLQDQFFKLYVGQGYSFDDIMKKFIYQQAMHMPTAGEASGFDECILVWHIGTNVYLRWYKDQKSNKDEEQAKKQQEVVEIVEALSNYMLFILVARPSMLPNFASRSHYVDLCYDLAENKFDSISELKSATSTEDFVRKLQAYGRSRHPRTESYTLWRGSTLGRWLIGGASATVDTLATDRLRRIHEVRTGPPAADNLEPTRVVDTSAGRNLLQKIVDASARISTLASDRQRRENVDYPDSATDFLKQIADASVALGTLATNRLEHIGNLELDLEDFNGIFNEAGVLEMIAVVWAKILFDASNNDRGAYSHARQLSNGGELLTIAAIMMAYKRQPQESFPEGDLDQQTA